MCNVHYRKLSWFERNAPGLLTGIAFAAIIALAAVLRFWQLGIRTFTNDEGLYSLMARQLARGGGYEHVPELHGPLQIMATAGVFKAFGDSDFTARFMPALCGVLLAVLPFLFRKHIGRPGAIAAALLLAVSPTMIYYSRFAGPDIYLAFFSLASAMIIWRYLAEPGRAWLYLLAGTLALAVVSTEMVLLVVPIFALYLHARVAGAFIAQASEPRVDARTSTHYDRLGVAPDADIREIRLAYKRRIEGTESRPERELMANAYHVLTTAPRRETYDRKLALQARAAGEAAAPAPGIATKAVIAAGASLIAATWPFAGFARRRLNLKSLPDAANPLLMMTLLTLPFYGPLVEKLPFVGDRGFSSQPVIIVIGGKNIHPGGELSVMLATLGVLFAITTVLGFAWKWHAWVICWAVFYGIVITLFTGFFTNRGGVWSGIWGSLDYTWRPETHHANGPVYYYGMMLPAYEFLPLAAVALGGAALLLIGGWRNRLTLLATAGIMAAIAVAPSWVPGITDHRVLLATIVAGVAVLSLRAPDLTKFLAFWAIGALGAFTMIGRKDPWLTIHVALPMIMLAAKLVNDAVTAFELSELTVPQFRVYAPRRLAQGLVLAGFAVLAVFTLRTGILAGWGHGDVQQLARSLEQQDHGDTPIELLTAQENAPDVRALSSAIDAASAASGQGHAVPIALDSSYGFSEGWAWYLRGYTNVTTVDMTKPYDAAAGAIVLVDNRNRFHVTGDQTSLSVTFTNTWGAAAPFAHLTTDDIASRLVSADAWSSWYRYLSDRTTAAQPAYNEGVAYFPRELSASVNLSRQSDVLSIATAPQVSPAPAAP
jgi:predicted membrane-bound mannosyltransferase